MLAWSARTATNTTRGSSAAAPNGATRCWDRWFPTDHRRGTGSRITAAIFAGVSQARFPQNNNGESFSNRRRVIFITKTRRLNIV